MQEECQPVRTGSCPLAYFLQGQRKERRTLTETFQKGKGGRCDREHKKKDLCVALTLTVKRSPAILCRQRETAT
jgi:hypothetical protein